MIILVFWNTILAAGMAIIIKLAGYTPWLRSRPAVLHLLWVVVALKLITPPLVPVPILSVETTGDPLSH